VDLARSWQPLAAEAHSSIRAFLTELCDRLEQSQISAEQLCERLSLAITEIAQEQSISYGMAVYTDQGPTRKRNEDACFPESGSYLTLTSEKTEAAPQLLIVCDGIGGHQGGDVASKLAIATIRTQLAPLLSPDSSSLSSVETSLAIEQAICAANDEISVQNDQAQRQARDRMGTTLVLALVSGADVYIAHLGDSRAYRISQNNCQQVTLDDDVASRQVRLGGSLYREMLTQPGAGSLVQALGMGPSQMLRPTVQRFVIDQDCVFLLCSDGLSDSDRVEQFWINVLKPLVNGERKADVVGQQLIALANKYNGHDNVTVGLLAARTLNTSERMIPRTLAGSLSMAVTEPSEATILPHAQTSQAQTSQAQTSLDQSSQPKTRQLKTRSVSAKPTAKASTAKDASTPARTADQNNLQKIGLVVLLLAIFGVLAYTILPGLRENSQPASSSESSVDTEGANADRATLPVPNSPVATVNFAVGDYLRIRQLDGVGIRSTPVGEDANEASLPDSSRLLLYPSPVIADDGAAENTIPGTIPTGGIARVLNKQTIENQTAWVQLELCSIPSGANLSEVPAETDVPNPANSPSANSLNEPESTDVDRPLFVPPGSRGWTLESRLPGFAEPITDLQSTQIGSCD
ncbi:PP2C family serine/threonine-protein phosphatase, partial [cf. Phormidesmis sp. LEGE 11477]|uniref:PP2C family protein-serine/threonine phosphatase n=1 Tax=cf. Phormidesmis sp. LEGE 11477 TaxID=1828680 RepID=UPI0018812134